LAAAETVEKSQMSTAEGRPAMAGTPAAVDTPTTVLALAGPQQQQYGHQQLMIFRGNSRKTGQKV
jgi:hypothetical protein